MIALGVWRQTADTSTMSARITILALSLLPLALAAAQPAHPWEARHSIIQPVDAGKADVNQLSTSNFVPSIELQLPTRFERVYRLSDVLRRGSTWDKPSDLAARDDGFVRFSGGVAAVFSFSRYTSSAQGRVSEIPNGTVFRLDLRPPSPSSVVYSPITTTSYNAVSLSVLNDTRDLRSHAAVAQPVISAAEIPDTREPTRSLWTDELFRGRTLTSLLDQTLTK